MATKDRPEDNLPELPPINEARIQAHLDRFTFELAPIVADAEDPEKLPVPTDGILGPVGMEELQIEIRRIKREIDLARKRGTKCSPKLGPQNRKEAVDDIWRRGFTITGSLAVSIAFPLNEEETQSVISIFKNLHSKEPEWAATLLEDAVEIINSWFRK